MWKVILGDGRGDATVPGPDTALRVQHALIRDETVEEATLAETMTRVESAFAAFGGTGKLIDQAFCRDIDAGVIRCYMVADQLVGFARQYPKGLSPAERSEGALPPPQVETIMGMPSRKTMHPPDEPALARLRELLGHDWLPGMQQILNICTAELPVLWDADFLFGPKGPDGDDTYVLCEINASCITPFPPEAVSELARAASEAIGRTTLT